MSRSTLFALLIATTLALPLSLEAVSPGAVSPGAVFVEAVFVGAEASEARIDGAWRLLETSSPEATTEGVVTEIDGRFWSFARDGRLQFRSPIVSRGDGVVTVSLFGNRQERLVALDDSTEPDQMVVSYSQTRTRFNPEPASVTERWERLPERPPALDLRPVPLGDPARALSDERIEAIRRELLERGERDQEVREVFETAGSQPTDEDTRRMMEIDADNTAWLLEVVAGVGWIDAERFGEEAAEAAWLIVQHTSDLLFKWTVLGILEEELRETGRADGDLALLWDRTRLWLGEKQRYGSQIFFGPEGMFVAPLEDPENVDERRASVGLEPLVDYLERFRERNEGRPLQVRREF